MHLRTCRFIILITALAVSAQPALGQGQATVLVYGTPIEKNLGPGQSHVFQVNMERDHYVQLVVDQHGIDVVVRVNSPEGTSLGEFDSPNGDEGPENVEFVASTAGLYTVTVLPLEQGQPIKGGRYEIRIVELRQATEQELSAARNQEQLKAKGFDLVSEVVANLPQIRLPQTRVRAQLEAADLLWSSDQQFAEKLTGDAIAGVNEYLASIDVRDEDFYAAYSLGMQLRRQVIASLAPHNPEMALNFLRSSRSATSPYGNKQQKVEESGLELSLAMMVIKNDPKQAFQLAENNLKSNPSPDLFQTVLRLRNGSPELASRLASEIVAKIEDGKLTADPQLTQLATNLIYSVQPPRNSGRSGTGQNSVSIISEEDYRKVIQKALSDALAYNPSTSDMAARGSAQNLLSALKSMSSVVDSIVPGSSVAIDKKLNQYNAVMDPNAAVWQKYQNTVNSGSTEAALEAIPQAPPEIRDQLYGQLSQVQAALGNSTGARQLVMDHIKNPLQRQQYLRNLEQQVILNAASQGRIDEALRMIADLRPGRRRCELLSQIASRIGPGLKRAAAINLLETARSLLGTSPKPENQEQLFALLQIANAFAKYDPTRSFEIIDPLIDQLNEITSAARTMNGFGQEFFQNDELNLQNGNSVGSLANQISGSLALLTNVDFGHTKAAAGRIQLSEIRLTALLAIARQAIMGQHSDQSGEFRQLRIITQ